MPHTFEGVEEKLIRAKELILNLQTEIEGFFQKGKYPILPHDDNEMFLEAITYHNQRPIPLRFSVLAGEIAHHLRSCLDHLVWQFSPPGQANPRRIEFPIFEARPSNKQEISRYEGKVQGVANIAVKRLIETLQPYNTPDPVDSPLLIIHNLDMIDKHRELVLCVSTGAFEVPFSALDEIVQRSVSHKRGEPGSTPVNLAAEIESHGKVVPQISFRNLGRREIQPIVPGLTDLLNCMVAVVAEFDRAAN